MVCYILYNKNKVGMRVTISFQSYNYFYMSSSKYRVSYEIEIKRGDKRRESGGKREEERQVAEEDECTCS